MFQAKVVKKIKTQIISSNSPPPLKKKKNYAIERIWKNIV